MLVSVVIPSYNRRESLGHCLESLFRQSFPKEEVEIVVVLDGSKDGSRELLESLSFPCAHKIFEQQNLGQAAARNRGISASIGRYVLLLDDDFVCDERLIQVHMESHTRPGIVVFGPILHDTKRPSIPSVAVDREIRPFYERHGSTPAFPWLPPNSSMERNLILSCGGYDESFTKAREDTEIGMRLLDLGVQFELAPAATVRQRYEKSAAMIVAESEAFGTNDVRLLRKRPDYVSSSNLSRLNEGAWWKRLARRLVARMPFSGQAVLAIPYSLCVTMQKSPTFLNLGVRLLNLRRYIVWIRAAVKEAGGWNRLLLMIEHSKSEAAGCR